MADHFDIDGGGINEQTDAVAGGVVNTVLEIELQPLLATVAIGYTVQGVDVIDLTLEFFLDSEGPEFATGVSLFVQMELFTEVFEPALEVGVEATVPEVLEVFTEMDVFAAGPGFRPNQPIEMTIRGEEPSIEINIEANTPLIDLTFEYFDPPAYVPVRGFGQPRVDIESEIKGNTAVVTLYLESLIQGNGQPRVDIESEITDANVGTARVDIQSVIGASGTARVDLESVIIDDASFTVTQGDAIIWNAEVILDGIDISERLTGVITVEAEEGTARVATFRVRPFAGIIDLLSFTGNPVSIYYKRLNTDGTVQVRAKVFTGFVDEPEYDPNTRVITYNCSDNLQKELENMDRDTIDNLIPDGLWHPAVFEEDTDNFSYSQNRLETTRSILDKDVNGTYRYHAFAAKETEDFQWGEDGIVDESLEVELASNRDVINDIAIEFKYGFERLRQREATFSWDFPGNFCEYLGRDSVANRGSYTLPLTNMVEGAVNGSNWCVRSLNYRRLPRSELVNCSTGIGIWVISETLRNLIVWGCSGTLEKRFAQTIGENWNIDVRAPQSIETYGRQANKRQSNLKAKFDTNEWESSLQCNTQTGVKSVGIPANSTGGNGLNDQNSVSDFFRDTDVDATDGTDRLNANEVIEIEIRIAQREILQSHRENWVGFEVPLWPTLERYHTVRIDTDTVIAKGKVRHVTHTMDLTKGSAVTSVVAAISRGSDSSVDETAIDIGSLERPDTSSELIETSKVRRRIELDTHYGGISDPLTTGNRPIHKRSVQDPADQANSTVDDQWTGYVGNKEPADIGSITYAPRFVIKTDDIDEDDRDEVEGDGDYTFDLAIPQDLLQLAA